MDLNSLNENIFSFLSWKAIILLHERVETLNEGVVTRGRNVAEMC